MAKRFERKTTAIVPAGPPRLTIPLWRNLGMMLLVNCIPIAAMVWAFVRWDGGPHLRQDLDRRLLAVTVGSLSACAVVAVAAWLVLPIARWLRDYPKWCFLHRSAALWFLPAVGGFLLWMVLAIAALVAVLASVVGIGYALLQLVHR
jgi:hypothetical protein